MAGRDKTEKANRVVIGVTGHRNLGPDVVFVEVVRSVIEDIRVRASCPNGETHALGKRTKFKNCRGLRTYSRSRLYGQGIRYLG